MWSCRRPRFLLFLNELPKWVAHCLCARSTDHRWAFNTSYLIFVCSICGPHRIHTLICIVHCCFWIETRPDYMCSYWFRREHISFCCMLDYYLSKQSFWLTNKKRLIFSLYNRKYLFECKNSNQCITGFEQMYLTVTDCHNIDSKIFECVLKLQLNSLHFSGRSDGSITH